VSAFRAALRVLWTGDGEAVVWKPAGLSSERPSSRNPSVSAENTGLTSVEPSVEAAAESAIVLARAQFGWPDAQLPHRLDRPTAGILMISANRSVAAAHAAEQREGRWTKWYVARLPSSGSAAGGGRSRAASELVGPQRGYLRRRGRLAEVVRSGGDPARHEVLAVAPATDRRGESHALLRLETGRFHQIRALMAHAGFPLVGDRDYGSREAQRPLELVAVALSIARAGNGVGITVDGTRVLGCDPALFARLRADLEEIRVRDEAARPRD
jgi:23S rRNA pseudouridine1911/1915/1917 synthase